LISVFSSKSAAAMIFFSPLQICRNISDKQKHSTLRHNVNGESGDSVAYVVTRYRLNSSGFELR
jgi:hypothetical protein